MTDSVSTTRFGVIGTGRITRRLVADLQSTDGVEVTAIASRTAARAAWYADQYGIAQGVEGYGELLRRDDVDAVYIALPPSLHAQWTIAAAEHGKQVLCEKPLGVHADEVQAMDQACRQHQVRWLDATGWLHHQRTAAFADWIAADRFGKLGHISASVSFFEPFQSGDHRLDAGLGGGALLDLGWYTAGLVRFVAGRMPIAVLADAVIRDGVIRRVTGMLWFDDNVSATISCGYDTATRKWFEVAGSTASLVCDDFTRPWAERPTRCWIHEASGKVEQHTYVGSQERHMIMALIGNEPLDRWHRQAVDTQRIIDALAESIQHQSKVSLGRPAAG